MPTPYSEECPKLRKIVMLKISSLAAQATRNKHIIYLDRHPTCFLKIQGTSRLIYWLEKACSVRLTR